MEEKKSKSSVVIIIILLLLVLGLTGYLLIEKDIIKLSADQKTEEKESTDKEEIENIDIKNSYIIHWFEQVHGYGIGGDKEIYEKGGATVAEMSASYKFNLASNSFVDKITDYAQPTPEGYTAEISEQIVKEEYQKLFGPNTYQPIQTLLVVCNEFTYDATGKRYVTKSYGCGGTSSFSSHEEIISATKQKDRIEIVSAVVYADRETNSLYKHYNKTEKLTTIPTTPEEITTYIKTNKDNLEQYMYTFKQNEDGFYYYHEVKRTKE